MPEAIEPRVASLLEAARARWPGVAVDDATFVRYIAERVAHDEGPEKLELGDLYLACGCANGIAAAMEHFEQSFLTEIGPTLARVDASHDFVEEARQRVRERLFVGERPRIAEYSGRGPLGGWLRVVALRTALNLRRESKTRQSAERLKLEELVDKPDLEVSFVKQKYGAEVEAALEHAMTELAPEQRRLLRRHYLDRVTMDDLAREEKVNRSTISRRISDARAELLEAVKQDLSRRVKLSANSMQSVLRVVGADLEISLRGLLVSGK